MMRLAALVLGASLAGTETGWAGDPPPDCATAALLDYSRQTLALSQAPEAQPIPSVEAIVAKRRLQEAYCLRSTHCLLGAVQDIAFRAEFGRCLSEEAEQGK